MRRKHLILASCIISALLLTFTFHVSADENVTADAGASSNSAPLLDSYFWSNYDLLPYIESDDNQYIATGIIPNYNGTFEIKFSVVDIINSQSNYVFGVYGGDIGTYGSYINANSGLLYLTLYNLNESSQVLMSPYSIHTVKFDQYDAYLDGDLVLDVADDYSYPNDLALFCRRSSSTSFSNYSHIRIYSCSYYDNVDDEYDVYYYPARSKSGNVIGLYDAISKTFVTTGGSVPFASPTDDKVIHFQIGDFITSGLGWIGDILDFAIQEPMILMFMAIGLCGVAFRWARRVVHF